MWQSAWAFRNAAFLRSPVARRVTRPNVVQWPRVAVWSTQRPLSNQDLVQRRLSIQREKKQARERSIQQRAERNLHIRQLSSSTPLYALKVTVDEQLREEMRLSAKEKRGRVFIEPSSLAAQDYRALTKELHGFFRALRKDTFALRASYPMVEADGTVLVDDTAESWTIQTDDDVREAFRRADAFFTNHAQLKRPSLILHIERDPHAPPPPPPPAYLENLADPIASPTMTMLSFYAFPPSGIADPDEFAEQLRKAWKPFVALGRVYVAEEGVNAQMSVPTNILPNFMECCRSIDELGAYMENDINIDPVPLTREEFARAGAPAVGMDGTDSTPAPPFKNLHIRVRKQVVADGLDKTYDWQSAGYDMPPLEWHAKLKEAKEAREQGRADAPLILDCRNTYETSVGRFEGAVPLDTESFRDSWDVLKERLADTPKDAPIMAYCTGGIRCVKVGAYLTQELGFTNVSRLAGGIIAYDRTLQENAKDEEPMFKGTNFVFDGRLARPITDHAFGVCFTCGSETSLVSNCLNENCHKRMVQCEGCRTSFHGACSDACRQRILNGAMHPRRALSLAGASTEEAPAFATIDEYSLGHSSPLPLVYAEMELNTRTLIPSGSHMVSGASQGRLLTQLASMTREGRILELGTFTGYATACLLEGAVNVGHLLKVSEGSRSGGPYVMSIERDAKAFDVAVAQLGIVAQYGFADEGAEHLSALRSQEASLVPSNEDIVKLLCEDMTTVELIRVSDALAAVEEIAAGRGDLLPAPFDMVFVDADKTRLIEYVDACLSSDLLLKKGGLIVVDNVLWKGLVLDASSGNVVSLQESEDTEESELRKNRRARKLASKMHRFNEAVVKDHRAEVLVLPLRDGLSVIRKR